MLLLASLSEASGTLVRFGASKARDIPEALPVVVAVSTSDLTSVMRVPARMFHKS